MSHAAHVAHADSNFKIEWGVRVGHAAPDIFFFRHGTPNLHRSLSLALLLAIVLCFDCLLDCSWCWFLGAAGLILHSTSAWPQAMGSGQRTQPELMSPLTSLHPPCHGATHPTITLPDTWMWKLIQCAAKLHKSLNWEAGT